MDSERSRRGRGGSRVKTRTGNGGLQAIQRQKRRKSRISGFNDPGGAGSNEAAVAEMGEQSGYFWKGGQQVEWGEEQDI